MLSRLLKSPLFLFPLALFASLSPCARGASVNVTVDDQKGDENTQVVPTYSPASTWNQGATCSGCLARPDASLAFDNTWHDATFAPNDAPYTIEIGFTGTAVYAFFILANNVEYATTLTNLSFSLDGSDAGTFVHIPSTSTDYQYNVPGYVNENLQNTGHTLTISAVGSTNNSLVLFDYLVYTVEESTGDSTTTTSTTSTTSSSSSTTNPIISTATSTLTPSTPATSSSSSPPQSSTTLASDNSSTALQSSLFRSTSSSSTTSLSLSQTRSSLASSVASPAAPSAGIVSGSSSPAPTNDRSASKRSNMGAIIGGIVGGVVALILIVVIFLCARRRSGPHDSLSVRRTIDDLGHQASAEEQGVPQMRGGVDILSVLSSPPGSLTVHRPTSEPNASKEAPYLRPKTGPHPPTISAILPTGANRNQNQTLEGDADVLRFEDTEKAAALGTPPPASRTDDAQMTRDLLNPGSAGGDGGQGSEHVLLSRIALLQAEVDRLYTHQDSLQSEGDEPPPDYFTEGDTDSVPR